MNRLLAKRGKNNSEFGALLQGHLKQVKDVADAIISQDILQFTGLKKEHIEQLSKAIPLVAILHDLGKANTFFQEMLKSKIPPKQPIRHEVISDWLLRQHEGIYQAVLHYLNLTEIQHPEYDWRFVALRVAILGHHLKFPKPPEGPPEEIKILVDHLDFTASLRLLEDLTGVNIENKEVPPMVSDLRWLKRNVWDDYRNALKQSGLNEEVRNDEGKYASFLRIFLLAADSIGSVASATYEEWKATLQQITESIQGIDLENELQRLIEESLRGRVPDPEILTFQNRVGESGASVTVVEAGCGSGKTIASYRWAINRHARNLFLTYPTTATATQGYMDYGLLAPEMTKLLHSRSNVDMELLSNGEEENDFEIFSMLTALDQIQKPFVLCTVDTILGVLENYRSSAILFTKLLNGVIVFDEVHSYDEQLFLHLLEFLRTVPVATLIMSASLQNDRKKMIQEVLQKTGRSIHWVKGPQEYEKRLRYRIIIVDDLPEEVLWSALEEGKKVLIIANQVEIARSYYEDLKENALQMGLKAHWFLYHSRFEYQDRFVRQQEIVAHFREEGAMCAITTQIAEFSFDISADLLISEIADFPSMIQRLGRLNRYAKEGDPVRPAFFFLPKHPQPYREQDLKESLELLSQLQGRDISQYDLNEKLDQLSEKDLNRALIFDWARLYNSQAAQSLRKPGYSVSCLRESHYDPLQSATWQHYQKYLLPMPAHQIPKGVRKIRSAYLIPDEMIEYTKEKGGRWKG